MLDHVVAREGGVEALEHVGVHGAVGGLRAVLHAVGEGRQNAVLEIGTWVGGGHRGLDFRTKVAAAEAQHVDLDTRLNQRGFGCHELGHPRRGVQGDTEPDLVGVGVVNAMPRQEVARRIGCTKVNIDTDLRLAMTAAIRQVFAESPKEFDPRKYLAPARNKVKELKAR